MLDPRKDKIEQWLSANADKLPEINDVAAIAFTTLAETGAVEPSDAAEHPNLFKEWDGSEIVKIGKIRRDPDDNKIYKRIQPQSAPEIYKPHEVPALWTEVAKPGEYKEIKANPLPTEAFGLNEIGWWKTKDNLWKSLHDANVYNPESYPLWWEKI